MRVTIVSAAILTLAISLCYAQTTPSPHKTSSTKHHTSVERPIDKGPYTPEANAAYQGGGVILQGAPGGPAPQPEATPPGQVPRGAVPQE
jgi:hypothetical protein